VSGPKYQHAVDVIKEKIASGEVTGEITLGRIRELTGATDSTSRRTAKELVDEGILENHPGAPYAVIGTAEDAAKGTDSRPLKAQVAELQRQVAELRQQVAAQENQSELAKQVGRIEANLMALYGDLKREYPRGGRRERAKAAASGGRG
jgi:DNA-binding transcriptional regulator YhcF (GntR family)